MTCNILYVVYDGSVQYSNKLIWSYTIWFELKGKKHSNAHELHREQVGILPLITASMNGNGYSETIKNICDQPGKQSRDKMNQFVNGVCVVRFQKTRMNNSDAENKHTRSPVTKEFPC